MKRLLACALVLLLPACGGDGDGGITGATEITSQELTVGTGATAALGDVVTVHYILTVSGNVIQSSYELGSPFTFQIGVGSVIPGFERGVLGMRVGGKRRVSVPPALGYGNQANGSIPPNSTLNFEIELVSIAGR